MIKDKSGVSGFLGVGISLAVALDNIAIGIGVGLVLTAGYVVRKGQTDKE